MAKHFKIDSRVIINLGRDSIKDTSTAILELVKNGFDADAHNVDVDIFCNVKDPYIRIADNGSGMTEKELNNNWLRIGYSQKRKEKVSKLGRRKTGEKGIGRISTDRLGSDVCVITKSEYEREIHGIRIDWDEFDKEGVDITDVDVNVIESPKIAIPKLKGEDANSGTEIIIRSLRQQWNKKNIQSLRQELTLLTPPFYGIEGFEVKLENDIDKSVSGKLVSKLFEIAEIELLAEYDGNSDEIIYTIKDKDNQIEKSKFLKLEQLYERLGKNSDEKAPNKLRCGPIEIKLLFYRRVSSLLEGTEFKLSDLRKFLDVNAGIKIYRDNIAVKPYGFPQDEDWLGLAERKASDPAGVSRKTYKITPNQLVGAIFISRDKNKSLTDSAGREGLIEGEAFYDLKDFTEGCINLLESYRYIIEKEKPKKRRTISEKVQLITDELTEVKEDLLDIREGKYDEIVEPINKNISKVDHAIEKTEETFGEFLDEKRVLTGLATLGISSAVFGHETEFSVSEFIDSTALAKDLLKEKNPDIDSVIEELNKAIKYSKQVSAWGAFSLARVELEKRRFAKRNIKDLVDTVLEDIKEVLEAANIDLVSHTEPVLSKTYSMNIESIILNLITNSYTACLQKPNNRKIEVKLLRDFDVKENLLKGYIISVADSGPGIAEEYKERIWEPLFTTKSKKFSKKTGTGLGLTIVRSTVEELKGTINVSQDEVLKGAKFVIWIPRILK